MPKRPRDDTTESVKYNSKFTKLIHKTGANPLVYFKSLPPDNKIDIINKLEGLGCNDPPILFRILKAEIPDEIKKEFLTRVNSSDEELDKINIWADTLLRIPFNKYSSAPITSGVLKKSQSILDSCIYGNQCAKRKILQLVAQSITNPCANGLILGLNGPKGTGKTTLAEDGISKALGKPFVRLSLGGSKDSSYIEGFSYTYIGSKPGVIVESLIKAQVQDPVIFFDELDKVSNKEVTDVLIHITDPCQNKKYQDKYFSGVNIDLSRATLVFSYNDSSCVDPILLDRITEVTVDTFTIQDKIQIAKWYLIPSIIKDIGIFNYPHISDKVLAFIIKTYTDEAGVRMLKKILYDIYREINLRTLLLDEGVSTRVTNDLLRNDILRRYPINITEKISRVPCIGSIAGLYVTGDGGGVMYIETVGFESDATLEVTLTGNQSDVMKESMEVAKTVAINYVKDLGVTYTNGLHIHIPDGYSEKDGSSASVAACISIISFLTNRKINNKVAVTGELTTHGKVKAIGGLGKKILGAKDAGIELVLAPKANVDDIKKIQHEHPNLLKTIDVQLISTIKDAVEWSIV